MVSGSFMVSVTIAQMYCLSVERKKLFSLYCKGCTCLCIICFIVLSDASCFFTAADVVTATSATAAVIVTASAADAGVMVVTSSFFPCKDIPVFSLIERQKSFLLPYFHLGTLII